MGSGKASGFGITVVEVLGVSHAQQSHLLLAIAADGSRHVVSLPGDIAERVVPGIDLHTSILRPLRTAGSVKEWVLDGRPDVAARAIMAADIGVIDYTPTGASAAHIAQMDAAIAAVSGYPIVRHEGPLYDMAVVKAVRYCMSAMREHTTAPDVIHLAGRSTRYQVPAMAGYDISQGGSPRLSVRIPSSTQHQSGAHLVVGHAPEVPVLSVMMRLLAQGQGLAAFPRRAVDPFAFRLFVTSHEFGHTLGLHRGNVDAPIDPEQTRTAEMEADLYGVGIVLLETGNVQFARQLAAMRAAQSIATGRTEYLTHLAVMELAELWGQAAPEGRPKTVVDLIAAVDKIVAPLRATPVISTAMWGKATSHARQKGRLEGAQAMVSALLEASTRSGMPETVAAYLTTAAHIIGSELIMPGDICHQIARDNAVRALNETIEADIEHMVSSRVGCDLLERAMRWAGEIGTVEVRNPFSLGAWAARIKSGTRPTEIADAARVVLTQVGRVAEGHFAAALERSVPTSPAWKTGFLSIAREQNVPLGDLDAPIASSIQALEALVASLGERDCKRSGSEKWMDLRALCRKASLPSAGRSLCERTLKPEFFAAIYGLATSPRRLVELQAQRLEAAYRQHESGAEMSSSSAKDSLSRSRKVPAGKSMPGGTPERDG